KPRSGQPVVRTDQAEIAMRSPRRMRPSLYRAAFYLISPLGLRGSRSHSSRFEIEPNQNPVSVRQIPNNLFDRLWQTANQGGHSDNLVALRQLRIAQQVNYFDAVLASQMSFANLLQIGECGHRLGSGTSHIQAQIPGYRFASPSAPFPRF